jgi:hypothetical protein
MLERAGFQQTRCPCAAGFGPWSVEIFHTLYFIIQTFPGPWSQTPTPAVLASCFLLLRSSFLILASRLLTLASHFFLASARSMAVSATGAISA